MKKIIIINQKGGVGKSTISVNLSYSLANKMHDTLLIDLDPQGQSSAIYSNNTDVTIANLFNDPSFNINKSITQAVVNENVVEKLKVIKSTITLARVAELISVRIHKEKILHHHLSNLKFDYMVADCPPNLGSMTINAIYCADIILIPVNYDKGALDGMADLLKTIKEVKENSIFKFYIILNEFDIRNKQTNSYIENELKFFEKNIFKTKIRKFEAINQARIVNEPIFTYLPNSKGTIDFDNLTQELISCLNF